MFGITVNTLKHSFDAFREYVVGVITEVQVRVGDKGRVKVGWNISKFNSEADYLANKQYTDEETIAYFGTKQNVSFKPNLLLNEGITELLTLVATTGATKFDNANAYLAVGDSTTAEAATQTDLQASTNKLYKAMDATYPQVSNQSVTWQATFASADANWAWNEFSVANGSSGTAKNLNRKVSAQSTKIAGQVWVLQLTITLS